MTRTWRLTRQAEQSLVDIALWTFETFGPVQAAKYEQELVTRCQVIADGHAVTQSCAALIEQAGDDLRFTRAGEHFVVFLEGPQQVIIVDFLHGRRDLQQWTRRLQRPT